MTSPQLVLFNQEPIAMNAQNMALGNTTPPLYSQLDVPTGTIDPEQKYPPTKWVKVVPTSMTIDFSPEQQKIMGLLPEDSNDETVRAIVYDKWFRYF
jgi:hypothetical protein